MTARNTHFERVLKHLLDIGFLHVAGNEIPNVRELVTGRKSKGSWWTDPASHRIFAITQALEDHPDVTITKLISNKVTFLHRKLWRELVAVAAARDDWQLAGLSQPAHSLLKEVDDAGTLLTNSIKKSAGAKIGDTARELESRLLIHSDQFHTDSGAHAKRLETWQSWAKRVGLNARALSSSKARKLLEKHLEQVNRSYSGHGRLPWQA